MTGDERRAQILQMLMTQDIPLSGTALANEFPVSNLDAVSRSENVFHTVNIYFEIHIYICLA